MGHPIVHKFRHFQHLSEELRDRIRYFHIGDLDYMSKHAKIGFVVTTDDKVMAFGLKVESLLKDIDSDSNCMTITELSDQKIQEFYFGRGEIYARSGHNKVFVLYHWNQFFGTETSKWKPHPIEYFNDKDIIDISLGEDHCLALSSDGLVYGWGANGWGQVNPQFEGSYGNADNCLTTKNLIRKHNNLSWDNIELFNLLDSTGGHPVYKHILLNSKHGIHSKVKSISCFNYTSVVVTSEGRVQYWGQPGQRSCSNTNVVKALSKGYCYRTLDDYPYLLNSNGQVIYQDRVLTDSNVFVTDIIRIGSNKRRKSVVCQTKDRVIRCTDESHSGRTTMETDYKNFFEYYLHEKQITYKTIEINNDLLYVNEIVVNNESEDKKYLEVKSKPIYESKEQIKTFVDKRSPISLEEFKFFDDLAQNVYCNVQCYHISGQFHSKRYFAIIVMNDQKVYAMGNNRFGQLGLGHNRVLCDYQEIEKLSNKDIEEFYEGYECMFARSKDNRIYSWGSNEHGQLGLGFRSKQFFKPFNVEYFNDKKIINISCGESMGLALSSKGVVYAWYYTRLDINPGLTFQRLKLVNSALEYLNLGNYIGTLKDQELNGEDEEVDEYNRIVSIHCYEQVAFVVTFFGQVCWNEYFTARNIYDTTQLIVFIPWVDAPLPGGISKVIVFEDASLQHNILMLDYNGCLHVYENEYAFVEQPVYTSPFRKYITNKGKMRIDEQDINKIVDINFLDRKYKYKLHNEIEKSAPVVQTEDYVHEIHWDYEKQKFVFLKTECVNFYEYYSKNLQTTHKTIHMSEDGSLNTLEIPSTDRQYIDVDLSLELTNVYNMKFEKYFNNLGLLGEGTFGTVYKVEDKSSKRLFAIKKINVPDDYYPLLDEIMILSKLKSDFVVQYITAWSEGKVNENSCLENDLYIQMELCCDNLTNILRYKPLAFNRNTDQPMSVLEFYLSLSIFKELTIGLQYLHDKRIIHRDLRTDNILISDGTNGRFIKIGDFGLATNLEYALKEKGIGNKLIRAPEIDKTCLFKSGFALYDHKADIFSLGVNATKIFDIFYTFFEEIIEEENIIVEVKIYNEIKFPEQYVNTCLEQYFETLIKILVECICSVDPNERPDCQQLLSVIDGLTPDSNALNKQFEDFKPLLMSFNEKFFIKFLVNKLEICDIDLTQLETNNNMETMDISQCPTGSSSGRPLPKRTKQFT